MVGEIDQVGLEAIIRGVGTYAANAGKIVTSNQAINKSLAAVAKGAALFQKAVVAATKIAVVAIGIGIAASINVFKNFDQAMTESIAIMGDVSDAMRQDMEKAARDVAKTTTFSMTQAAESYFFLASAGLSAKQSIAALPQVAAFAQAGAFDMATATDLLTDAQSALGLVVDDTAQNIENMARVSDVLVKANTLANATVEQFSTALTREAGAALKSFKIDVEEGVAVLAAFADQGVKGEIAGTGLSRILRLMTSAAVNNSEAYEELGIKVFDASGNINNLGEIIADLEVALGGMSDAQRVAALEALGFQARVQGVILPLLGTSDAIAEYEAGLRSAGGITAEVADKQLQSLGAQFSLLRSAIEDVLFTIGKELEPGLRALVRTLREKVIPIIEKRLPQAIARMKEVFADVRPSIDAFVKVFKSGIETILPIVKGLFNFINDNKAAMIASIVAIGAAIVISFGPLSIAAAAIVGLIAVIGLVRQNWDTLKRETLQVLRAIGDFIDDQMGIWDEVIIGTVTRIVNFVRTHWDRIFSIIQDVMRAIRIEIESRLRFLIDLFQFFNAVLHGKWSEAWKALKDLVITQLRLLREKAENSLELLKNVFSLAFEVIGNVVIGVVEDMVNKVIFGINKMGDALNKVTGLARAIKIPIPELGEIDDITLGRIRLSGQEIAQGLADATADATTSFMTPDMILRLTEGAPEAGEAIAEGVEDGLEDTLGGTVSDAIAGAADEIEDAAKEAGRAAGISFSDAFTELVSDLPGLVDSVISDIGRVATGPSIESAGEAVELANLRIAEADVEEKAAKEQAERLADIANLEEDLAIIRENSARKVADLEGTLAKIREDSAAQIGDLEGQLLAIARQRRRILGEPEPPPDPVDVSDLVGTLEDAETKLEQFRRLQQIAQRSGNISLFQNASEQAQIQQRIIDDAKAAIGARLDAEETRIREEIALKEAEFAAQEARVQQEIVLQQELVTAAENRVNREIAALEQLRGPNERKLEDIQDEIDALGDLAKQRDLERDLLLARIEASNRFLKSDQDILDALEEEIGRVDDLTGVLIDLDPATVDATDALLLLQSGLDDFAQELLEVLAIVRNPALQTGTAATMFTPRFHRGGVVPGSQGQEMAAILQAGEVVLPAPGTVSVAAASLLSPVQVVSQPSEPGGNTFNTNVHTQNDNPADIANRVRMLDLELASRLRNAASRGIR